MAERCIMVASLAVLVFHPSSTIKCFKPKSSTSSPQREKPPPPPPSKPAKPNVKKVPSKSKKKQYLHVNPSLSTSSSQSNTNKSSPLDPPPPPSPPPTLKTCKVFNMVSEFVKGEPSTDIVEAIFRSRWAHDIVLKIEKVFKVNHSTSVLNRFEEYRETVKSKAVDGKRMERLSVDGNELLRFHGTLFTCRLGCDGVSNICNKKCCGVCRVIDSNVSMKAVSTSLCKNSWRAHEKVTTECLLKGVSARKAIILCRVIAGRVVQSHERGLVEGEEGGFDSVVHSTGDQETSSEELIVFNPSAVLPCFVVIYSVP